MDAERRTEIRRWAEGLERSEVAEIRAAGRALTMLVEENEELARRLERLGAARPSDQPPSEAEPTPAASTRAAEPRRRRFPGASSAFLAARSLAAAVLPALAMAAARPDLQAGGAEDGASWARRRLRSSPSGRAARAEPRAEWRLDGRPVSPRRNGDRWSSGRASSPTASTCSRSASAGRSSRRPPGGSHSTWTRRRRSSASTRPWPIGSASRFGSRDRLSRARGSAAPAVRFRSTTTARSGSSSRRGLRGASSFWRPEIRPETAAGGMSPSP